MQNPHLRRVSVRYALSLRPNVEQRQTYDTFSSFPLPPSDASSTSRAVIFVACSLRACALDSLACETWDMRHDISRKHFSPYSFWSLLLYQIVSFDGNDKVPRVPDSMLPFEKAEKALSSTTKIEQYRLLLLFSIWSSNTQAGYIRSHHWRRRRQSLLPASSTDNWNGKRKDEQEKKRTYIIF